jgi:hypothetical protein
MTTVYFIYIRCPAGLDRARGEHRRVLGHTAFRTRRNFLPTRISQRPCFSVLRRALESPFSTVSLSVLAEAPLITSARSPVTGSVGFVATDLAAVLVPAVVAPADEEPVEAPPARQLVNRDTSVVQGFGCDRQKLGCEPEPWDDWLRRKPGSGPTAEGSSS